MRRTTNLCPRYFAASLAIPTDGRPTSLASSCDGFASAIRTSLLAYLPMNWDAHVSIDSDGRTIQVHVRLPFTWTSLEMMQTAERLIMEAFAASKPRDSHDRHVAAYVAEGLGENIDHCPSDNT